jgi:hypothetical protein
VSRSDEQPGRRARRSAPHDPHDAGDDEVVNITSVPETPADEQSRRMRVYFIQMIIRVACFVGAVLITDWPIRIVLIAGAVVLPYTAVIFANAGGERRGGEAVGMEYRELPAAPESEQPPVIDMPDERADRADDAHPDAHPDRGADHGHPGHAA